MESESLVFTGLEIPRDYYSERRLLYAVTGHHAHGTEVCGQPDNPEDVFTFLHKNFGCSRKVYNLCVDSLYRQLEAAGYQSGDDIPKPVCPKVSALKKEYPYLKEADAQGLSNSVMDFQSAWKRFLKQLTVRLIVDTLYLPKLKGGVKLVLHRSLPADARIENVTLSMETDGSIRASICYSYTLLVDMTLQEAALDGSLPENITFLGLDYSQQDFYVDSEGRKANCPKYYRRSEESLALLQRRLSHKEKDSRNYQKLLGQIRKLHTKIRNQRKDFLQKESTRLVSGYDVIVVEDLDLRGMGGALSLGKNLHDLQPLRACP